MNAKVGEEFYAQLIPIEEDRVLLPAAAVREAMQMERIDLNTGSPAWLLGFARLTAVRLPVISLEGMLGKSIPGRSTRSRLVRIVSITGSSDWLLLGQGQPHMTPLNIQALQPAPLEANDPLELVLSRARIANLSAFIPDLEAIEERISQALASAAEAAAEGLPDWQPGDSSV